MYSDKIFIAICKYRREKHGRIKSDWQLFQEDWPLD